MPKNQTHEVGRSVTRLLTDDQGSELSIETLYPDNGETHDVLMVTHHFPQENGEVETDTLEIVKLTNEQAASFFAHFGQPIQDAADLLTRLYLAHEDAKRPIDKRMAWATYEGAAQMFALTYYGNPHSNVYVFQEIRELWAQEKGERPHGYNTANEFREWRIAFTEELAARLALSILEKQLHVKRAAS